MSNAKVCALCKPPIKDNYLQHDDLWTEQISRASIAYLLDAKREEAASESTPGGTNQ